jgi:superfamily II DNA or RNA helicase
MPKCRLTVKDEVWCYFSGLSEDHLTTLWNKFAIFKDGYFFMPSYKLGRWDGKIRFFEKTGKTYSRLLDKILPIIDEWGYEIELEDKRKAFVNPTVGGELTKFDEDVKLIQPLALEAIGCDVIPGAEVAPGKPFALRPYQLHAVKLAVDAGSGFIIAGTGAGKTSITGALSYIYSQAGYRTITIVPSGDLVTQTSDWYIQLGMDVGIYSGDEKNIDHDNVVATWQALQYNPAILSEFQCLIWDEAHGIQAGVAQKLINESGKHIAFRFGVTGTLPKPELDQTALFSSIGSVLIEIPAWWLMKHGYLAKVDIQPVEFDETYVDEEFVDYTAERAFLSKSPSRMEKIADLIISNCATRGNTLVLVNSIPFGEKLASLIKGAVFLYGESPKDLRKEHYEMFENHDDLIVIASSGIASTGISIDRVFCLMMIDPGKSFIKAIQSIGRGLRMADDKKFLFAVDVSSKLKWAKKHAKERIKYYTEAQYNILKKITLKVFASDTPVEVKKTRKKKETK